MWADSGGVTTEVAWFFGDLYSYSDASYRVVPVSFICASLVNWCWSRRRTWMDNNYLGSAPSGSARVWKAVCARTARRVADSSLTPLGTSLDSAIFTIVLLRAMRSALSQRGGVRCGSGCRFPLHIAPAEFARGLQCRELRNAQVSQRPAVVAACWSTGVADAWIEHLPTWHIRYRCWCCAPERRQDYNWGEMHLRWEQVWSNEQPVASWEEVAWIMKRTWRQMGRWLLVPTPDGCPISLLLQRINTPRYKLHSISLNKNVIDFLFLFMNE